MKKNLLFLAAVLLCTVMISSSCSKNSTTPPCDGYGQYCFENKRDTTLIITVVQTHATITVKHDEIQCATLSGGSTYTIKFSGPAYTSNLKDSTFLVQNCDKKLIIINPPSKK